MEKQHAQPQKQSRRVGVQQQVSAGTKGRSMAPPPFTLTASAAQPAQLTAEPEQSQEGLEGEGSVTEGIQGNGGTLLQLTRDGEGRNRGRGNRGEGRRNNNQAQAVPQAQGQGQAAVQAPQGQPQAQAPTAVQAPAPAQNNPVNAPANNNANANNNNAVQHNDNDNDNDNDHNAVRHNDNDAIQDEEQRREAGPISCVTQSFICASGVAGEHVTFSDGTTWGIKRLNGGGFVYFELRSDPNSEILTQKMNFNFSDNKSAFSTKEMKSYFHGEGQGKYWDAFWKVTNLKPRDDLKLKTYAQEK